MYKLEINRHLKSILERHVFILNETLENCERYRFNKNDSFEPIERDIKNKIERYSKRIIDIQDEIDKEYNEGLGKLIEDLKNRVSYFDSIQKHTHSSQELIELQEILNWWDALMDNDIINTLRELWY